MNSAPFAMFALAAFAAVPFVQDAGRSTPSEGRGATASKGTDDARGTAKKSGGEKSLNDEDLAASYFATCDYDGDGWISYSEAQKSMNVDRATFAVFDVDRDGRITSEEFKKRYDAIVSRGGAFAPPIAKADTRRIPKRTAEELLDAFDRNKDLGLDDAEMTRALDEYGAHGYDAKLMLEKLDKNASKKLEVDELPDFLEILSPTPAQPKKKKFQSIAEMFDKTEVREAKTDATPQPARIQGPVSTFRRLDFDNSGGISVQDLVDLQRPLQLSVRTNAVVATLDTNGDGEISEAEFRAALR